MQSDNEQIKQVIWQWLDQVVIGLNLCPFAKKPRVNHQIKLYLAKADNDEELLNELMQELQFIEQVEPDKTDTTLFAVTQHLDDFEQYLNFLAIANLVVQQLGLEGKFQLASFHPNYQFAGTETNDRENLTNKAPCPIIHIIREATVEKVLKVYPNPEQIPDNNIECVENLSAAQVRQLFPFLPE